MNDASPIEMVDMILATLSIGDSEAGVRGCS